MTARVWLTMAALASAATIALGAQPVAVDAGRGRTAVDVNGLAQTPVNGAIEVDNACYVRLPDLPEGRYGGFGGYNPETGVLFYVGGAEKRTAENTIAYHDLYAIRLDGSMSTWNNLAYSANVGYLRETDRGCREMASVQIAPDRWVSVGGKDGCDPVSGGGDIKEIQVGAAASAAGVRWVPNSRADRDSLPQELADDKLKLVRAFATWDSERQRIVFGQGTFDDEKDQATQNEVYQATKRGSVWNVTQLRPTGQAPSSRYGSCATFISDHDSGLDGVLVLGGQQGGSVGTTTYKEVWWLDFGKSAQGEWVNVTGRFANMDAIGFRREGACAYNAETRVLYSWMGRADSKVPEGASRSSGAWMVDLSMLADANAPLTWQRLAKDKLDEPKGRHLIPSVYDARNNRLFAIGGRNDLAEYTDVWAVYPGVTGSACSGLDPYAPFRSAPATPATPATSATPEGTPVTPTATRTPRPTDPTPAAQECGFLASKGVPPQARSDALSNPGSVYGYQMLCNPNVPASPYNTIRTRLSIRNAAKPYHPMFNPLAWSCGCP